MFVYFAKFRFWLNDRNTVELCELLHMAILQQQSIFYLTALKKLAKVSQGNIWGVFCEFLLFSVFHLYIFCRIFIVIVLDGVVEVNNTNWGIFSILTRMFCSVSQSHQSNDEQFDNIYNHDLYVVLLSNEPLFCFSPHIIQSIKQCLRYSHIKLSSDIWWNLMYET